MNFDYFLMYQTNYKPFNILFAKVGLILFIKLTSIGISCNYIIADQNMSKHKKKFQAFFSFTFQVRKQRMPAVQPLKIVNKYFLFVENPLSTLWYCIRVNNHYMQ
jgi:hypothetical protein